MMKRIARLAWPAIAVLTACGRDVVTPCTLDLRIVLSPGDTTISLGDHFTAKIQLLGCGGTKVISIAPTWRSTDTTVAVVDSTSGVVTGVGRGNAIVSADTHGYGSFPAARVTVR